MYGMTLCSKHMHQMLKYGFPRDNIQRSANDLNDYVIKDDVAIFNIYNQQNVKIGEFIIDAEDLDKVAYKKWRFSHRHVVTGCVSNGGQKELSHIILGFTPDGKHVVDHIDGNARNNRKCNLRICTQTENVRNKSYMSRNTSSFIGVSFDKKRGVYAVEITKCGVKCHLRRMKTLEEAVYERYVAEAAVFGEFVNKEEHEKKRKFTANLPEETKERIKKEVLTKLETKGLCA